MTSTSNSNNNNNSSSSSNNNNNNNTSKSFHTYENVGYDDQVNNVPFTSPSQAATSTSTSNPQAITTAISSNNNGIPSTAIAINKTAIESPFTDPLHDPNTSSSGIPGPGDSQIFTKSKLQMHCMRSKAGQLLVTKLIALPTQSPMDSFKEWSVSTFKCTKQMINEKRGICSITNDAQLQADIEQLRENRNKLIQMLKVAQQMNLHYTQLVKTQRQLHGLMNEMSIKCFTNSALYPNSSSNSTRQQGKQVVANFSNLSNNLAATTTTSPTHSNSGDGLCEFLPILNHIKSSNVNLTEDFKKNGMALNASIKNGEKLVSALSFFSSNINTLINKTIEDTLVTIKQFESARIEYDAERNSINFTSPSAQTSFTYSSDKLELARVRYEQLKEDVQIKMKFLEENTIKVMHKQLLLFNSAFTSYSTGNTAALDSALRQFSIR